MKAGDALDYLSKTADEMTFTPTGGEPIPLDVRSMSFAEIDGGKFVVAVVYVNSDAFPPPVGIAVGDVGRLDVVTIEHDFLPGSSLRASLPDVVVTMFARAASERTAIVYVLAMAELRQTMR